MQPARDHDTNAFAAGLLKPDVAPPDRVTGPNGKAAAKRYNVYRNNVTVSLINALADIFPAVRSITGESFFRAMAREYVRAHPPTSPLLFQYGEAFADFVDAFPHASSMPYLGDIARIERGWLTAFHAADMTPSDAAHLAQIPPENIGETRFEAHPATFLIGSRFPVHDMVLMNRGYRPVGPVDMSVGQNLMLTRPGIEVRIFELEPGQHAFMAAIVSGQSLTEAAEIALAKDSLFNLNQALKLLLASGATCRILPA